MHDLDRELKITDGHLLTQRQSLAGGFLTRAHSQVELAKEASVPCTQSCPVGRVLMMTAPSASDALLDLKFWPGPGTRHAPNLRLARTVTMKATYHAIHAAHPSTGAR